MLPEYLVQAGSAMTRNKGVNLSRRQFCIDLAEICLVFFKAKHIFKEVTEFLNLVKLGLTQCEVVGYYERKLNFLIGYQNAPCGMLLVFERVPKPS